jgi:hypothetical protein
MREEQSTDKHVVQAFLIDPIIFKGFVQAGLPPFKNGNNFIGFP